MFSRKINFDENLIFRHWDFDENLEISDLGVEKNFLEKYFSLEKKFFDKKSIFSPISYYKLVRHPIRIPNSE